MWMLSWAQTRHSVWAWPPPSVAQQLITELFLLRRLLVHKDKKLKGLIWSPLIAPAMKPPFKVSSGSHSDHYNWCNSSSDFSAVILILTARATERTQIWLSSSFALLLSCTKCCRFWKMSNVWWMFPKVECVLNVKLRWNNFFFVCVCF